MSSKKPPKEFKRGYVLDNYEFVRKLGQGGYGFIYIVKNLENDEYYAMKIEKINFETRGLKFEIDFYKDLQDSPYFPKIYDTKQSETFRYIIMEILGPSFFNLKIMMPRFKFSKYTAFYAGYQMLKCIEELHKRGYIHRDVKLGNFLLRRNKETPICLIDFGLSRRYVDKRTGKMYQPRENPGFVGTTKYASVNALSGNEISMADDLISWFYTLVDMIKGELPWVAKGKDKDEVLMIKKKISTQTLCKGLPSIMIDLYDYINGLTYFQTPNYKYIYDILEELIQTTKKNHKCFDWEKLSRKKLKKISGIDIREVIEDGKFPIFINEKDIGNNICMIQ